MVYGLGVIGTIAGMMKRRDFLRATLITLGAAAVPGCNDSVGTQPRDPSPDAMPEPVREYEDGQSYFPQGIASGDPRSASVVLWTRIEDPALAGQDLTVELEVALDESFAELVALDGQMRATLTAEAGFDHCIKARIQGAPGTTYFYRFVYPKDGKLYVSRVGRTKTAPAEDADVPVRFAFVSCQDYIGRYYNNYLALAQEELDFFVHLGDYVYETAGDPSFQSGGEDRAIVFADAAGAITLGTGDSTYQAARSLDNYRQLYRTYRTDPALQTMHARFPMIATWDDHEFSDDSWGANATYFDGRMNELDEARRKAANQAWFEYMPVDYPDAPDFRYDPSVAFPDDIRIHRDFTFGKHVHLVMTNLRSYRPDHLIPENAFPGAVICDQAALRELPGGIPASAQPYVDIATYAGGLYQGVLVQAAGAIGYDPAMVTGNVSATYINAIVQQINNGPNPPPQAIPLIDPTQAGLERGISWFDCNKVSAHSSLGSRYFVHKDAFDVVAKLGYASDAQTQSLMGQEQESWFLATLQGSTRTWKVWGNEFTLCPLQIDMRFVPNLPPALARRFYLSLDAWDGFPEKRRELLEQLAAIGNVVAVTGDVHAFFAGTPFAGADPSKKIVEFVSSSITSTVLRDVLSGQVMSDPLLSQIPEAGQIAAQIDAFFLARETRTNPHLAHADSTTNGFCIAEANGTELTVTMHAIAATEAKTDYAGKEGELMDKLQTIRFRTLAGESELYKEIDGAFKRWDPATLAWVE